MSEAVSIENLRKTFDGVTAVDGVSLSLAPGKLTALLGPSGCGKTTLLRMLAGLERPDSGDIRIGERVLNSNASFMKPEHRRIGLVFQDYALFPHLTVRQNMAYGCRNSDSDLDALSRQLGLEGLDNQTPDQLSGGQQQRVALARALASRPDVLLLDEPFSNLDTQLRHRVREEMAEQLSSLGITTLLVTHDQEEALHLAHQVLVMFDGQIVQADRPNEIYERPANQRVANFVGRAMFLRGMQRGHEFDCELGTLRTASPGEGETQALLRPEALIVSPDKTGPGVVFRADYFGHMQMVHVRMDSGTELCCRMPGAFPDILRNHRVQIRVNKIVQTYPVC